MGFLKYLTTKIGIGKKLDLDTADETSFIMIANEYIEALGGKENIKDLYSCSTRLRVRLIENKLDENKLIEFGTKKIIKLDELNYQIVVGKNAMKLEEIIKKYLG